jgi:acetyltransferase-like isoleucine patch superfamily enzyme
MRGPCISRGAQIGINSCILPRVIIGEFSVIGAGSVVTKDIPAGMVAYGNPAQVVCEVGMVRCTTGLRERPYDKIEWKV